MNRWVDRVGLVAALVVTSLPFVAAALAWHQGWMPTSDWASVVLRAHDTLAGDVPLVGIYSSATTSAGHVEDLYHPGPLQEWLLAAPVHLFAPSTFGALVGSAALVALSCATVFWFAWRQGRGPTLLGATAPVALFMVATGPGMLREPLHTPLATYAMLAFLAAAVAAADNDRWGWPAAVFFGSLAGQAQVAFLVPVAVVGVVVVILRVADARSGRTTADQAGVPTRARGPATPTTVALTAAVTLGCWAAPLYDQFFGSGNLWALVTTGSGGDPVGPAWSAAELAKTLSIPPAWLFSGLHLSVEMVDGTEVVWHTSAWQWVTGAVVAVAVLWALWRTVRRGPSALRALGVVAVGSLIGAFVAATLLPHEAFSLLGHREIWRAPGLFAWGFLVGWVIFEVAGATGTSGVPDDVMTRHRRWAPRLGVAVALVLVAVAAVATIARSSPARDVVSGAYGGVEAFTAVASPWCDDGPVAVDPATLLDTPQALGLAAMLSLRGCEVHTSSLRSILPGEAHRATGEEPTRVIIDGFSQAPPGCEVAAVYDSSDPPEAYEGFDNRLGGLQRGGRLHLIVCRATSVRG